MRLLDRLAAWWTPAPPGPSPRALERARELRELYLEHLNEEPRSLEERVAYHLYHLSLYWSRCMGFLDVMGLPEAEIEGSLMVMVQVGTELSDADVRAYCREKDAAELGEAWADCEGATRAIRERTNDLAAATREAHARFERVDELRRARGLLHPSEARRARS